ncbi:Uma2 family endonuclease [Nocardioides sp. BGMRC 2183]|nr:Uma2 family endonuclease [Nocardioides sp. BGMRC 2183]
MTLTGLNLPFSRALTPDDLDRIPWRGAKFELLDGILVVSEGNISVDDLDEVPDDGHRYELLDGVLVVSPAPNLLHQRVSRKLHWQIDSQAPVGFEVFAAPTDVRLPGQSTRMQPDIVVTHDVDISAQHVEVPVLAVEVLSPSTRRHDTGLKKDLLMEAGCAHFWVVDPDVPSVRAWQLVDGECVEVGSARGVESLTLDAPFELTVVPQALTER